MTEPDGQTKAVRAELDEQTRAVLAERAAAGDRPMREASIAESRAATWGWLPYMGEPADLAKVEDRIIPSRTAEIPVRIYTPHGEGPFPALVVFHGGCWIVGNIHLSDRPHRVLAATTGCVVVAVNYQKAPEHPFPVPLEDCCAGYAWTTEHARELGIDPARIGVAGDSAGGNLAAAVCLRARDLGERAPAAQVLVYPALDPGLDTASARDYAEGFGLTTEDMRWSWQQYAPDEEVRLSSWVSPSRASSLEGLPPAVVVTAGFDILRDEGLLYAERLAACGVPTVSLHYEDSTHGFLWIGGVLEVCHRMLGDVRDALHRLWA
ncbi:alpha/beta hydrolase [Streptomyces spinoverrucosus]|uniref:alpha/beta hydrolase n=1 Tax=Streptomyces spinoverrucosus TaxID=284043 RepID=UPI0027DAA528|nr:alpha/beta hydrolase [Streptomyces spinoverrucosus]